MNRTAPSQGPDANAERDAFDRALAPHFPELLQATRRELRYRLSLNQFAPDDLTPEQLLDMALQRARCERTRLPPDVDIKARALALIFRMAEVLTARNWAPAEDIRAAARRGRTRPPLRRRRG